MISYPIRTNCWLNNFNEEYVNAKFDHPGKRIHPRKTIKKEIASTRKDGVIGTGKIKRLDKYEKDCYDRNNARNRDAFTTTKCNDMLKDETYIKKTQLVEDDLIELLDEHTRYVESLKR